MNSFKNQSANDSIWNKLTISIMATRSIFNIIFNIFTLVIACLWLIIILKFEHILSFIFLIALSPFILGNIMYILIFIPLKIELFCYEKEELLLGLFFAFIILFLQTIIAFIFYYSLSYELLWSNKNITLQNIIPEFFITYFCIVLPYDFMAKRDDNFASYIFANCFSVSVGIGLISSLFLQYNISAIITFCILLLNIPITLYIKKEYLTEQYKNKNS